MLFNHDSGLIQSLLTIDTTVQPALGGTNTLQIVGSGGLILPIGTALQRPQTPVAGTQRFNTDTSKVEYHNGTTWIEGADGTVQSVTVASNSAALVVSNPTVTTSGTITLSLDQTLVNLAASPAPTSGGPVVRLANDTFISRTFTATAPAYITDGDGVAGNPNIYVNPQLTGLSEITTQGFITQGVDINGQPTYVTKSFASTGDITLTEAAGVLTFGYTASGDLAALTALGNGIVVKTGSHTYAAGSIGVAGNELSITGANTASPVITYTPSANVAAVNALTGTGYVTRQLDGSLVTHSITGTANTATGSIVVTDGGSVTGTSISFTPGTELAGLAALSTTGLVSRTATGTYLPVTVSADTATATGQVTVANGDGSGNIVIGFTSGTEIAGLASLGTSGLVARTAAGTYTGVAIQGSTNNAGVITVPVTAGVPQVVFTPSTEIEALSTLGVTGLISRSGAGVYTGKTIVGQGSIVVTYDSSNNINISYTAGANLGSLDSLSSLGFVMQTSAHGFEERVLAGVAGNTVITNANGVNGNPTVDLAPITQASSGTFSKVTLDSFGRVTGNTAVTTADITSLVDATYVNVTGDTMAGVLNMGGNVISNVGTPVNGADAVTKNYVDTMSTGLSWKQSALAATTGNITLSGAQTVDGVTPANGDRILVKSQTNHTENGIWIYSSTGAWSRATDLDSPAESKAATLFIEQGTTYANTAWTQTDVVATIGSSPLDFTQFAGAGAYMAGAGLTLTGNEFSITAPISTSLGGTGLTTFGTSGQVLGVGASGLEYKSIATGNGISIDNPNGGPITVTNTGVLSNLAGTGIAIDTSTGNSTISNTGVLDVVTTGTGIVNTVAKNGHVTITGTGVDQVTPGAGISASISAGNLSVANTGVLSLATTGTGVAVDVHNGNVTITGNAVTTVTPGLGISTDQTTAGTAIVKNTGVVALASGTASLATAFDATTGTATVTNNGITSAVAGTGITVSNSGVGAATIANTGVLTVAVSGTGVQTLAATNGTVSIVGTGVDRIGTLGTGVSAIISSGALSIDNTGVTSVVEGTGITLSGGTGAVTISTTAVQSVTAGVGVSVIGDNVTGQVISNIGVVTLTGTANQIVISNVDTDYTAALTADVTIANSLSVTALGANKVLRTGAGGLVQAISLNDGQFIIGATGAAPTAGSIVSTGNSLVVTNTPNGISIDVAGGIALNSVTGAIAVGSESALTVTNTAPLGTNKPVITYGVAAGLESLAALADLGILVQTSAGTLAAKSLVAGTGISLANANGSAAGNITVTNTGVTSVGLSLPSIFTVSTSTVTTTGTLTAALASQAQATVFAAPATGSGAPSFRALVPTDIGLTLYAEKNVSAVAPSATGANSQAFGSAAAAVLTGQTAHASGQFAYAGDAQAIEMVLRAATTNASATELFLDGATLQALLPQNTTWNFQVQVVGRRTDGVGTKAAAAYRFDGIISQDATASSTGFVGIPSKVILGESVEAWDAAVSADTSSGALKITATGQDAANVKWVATIRATQVTG